MKSIFYVIYPVAEKFGKVQFELHVKLQLYWIYMDLIFSANHPTSNSSKCVKYFQGHGSSLCTNS
jgi:hypothetical protein